MTNEEMERTIQELKKELNDLQIRYNRLERGLEIAGIWRWGDK